MHECIKTTVLRAAAPVRLECGIALRAGLVIDRHDRPMADFTDTELSNFKDRA